MRGRGTDSQFGPVAGLRQWPGFSREGVLEMAEETNAQIGALMAVEARKPRGVRQSQWTDACKRIASELLDGDTARLSFEPDKVEWVVLVYPDELTLGTWKQLDDALGYVVKEACS